MSQRLAIIFKDGNDTLLAVHYRWGVYTKCAAGILDDFCWAIQNRKLGKEHTLKVYRLMRMCENLGGSLMDELPSTLKKVNAICKKHGRGHKFRHFSKNDGEFQFSAFDWVSTFESDSNGKIVFDISTGTVSFDVFNYWTKEDFDSFGKSISHKVKLPFGWPLTVPLADAPKVREFFDKMTVDDYFKTPDGLFVTAIY